MQVEDFKTWHWVVIGLVVGLLFSAVHVWAGPWFTAESLGTILQGEFEHHLLGETRGDRRLVQRFHAKQPVIKDVVVHPPFHGDDARQFWVTGKLYAIGPQHKVLTDPRSPMVYVEQWTPFKYPAAAPYIGDAGAKGSFPTVTAYLAAMTGVKASDFTYRFAWQETPLALWTLPPLAGLLTIGIAWPVALSAMQTFGMARPPKRVKVAMSLVAPAPVPRPVPFTAGIRIVPPPAPVKEPPLVSDSRKYGGEFYPVVKKANQD